MAKKKNYLSEFFVVDIFENSPCAKNIPLQLEINKVGQ